MDVAYTRSSLRPIRSLLRGLEALHQLNIQDGVSIAQISREMKLPRTTALRLLETLAISGYAVKDPIDNRYRTTVYVRRLADGFGDEDWVRNVAQPILDDLGREVVWPLAISTQVGLKMVARVTTDRESPLAVERFSAGEAIGLVSSCSGLTFLSFCEPSFRDPLIDVLSGSTDRIDALAKHPERLELQFNRIREQGYGTFDYPTIRRSMLAVPILANGAPLGCLALRYVTGALTETDLRNKYAPKLQGAADKIAQAFSRRDG